MSRDNTAQLIDRIKDNYNSFLKKLEGKNTLYLIAKAGHIAAVKETYEILTEHYAWDNKKEIDTFLRFRNPLLTIAIAYERRRKETASKVLHEILTKAMTGDIAEKSQESPVNIFADSLKNQGVFIN